MFITLRLKSACLRVKKFSAVIIAAVVLMAVFQAPLVSMAGGMPTEAAGTLKIVTIEQSQIPLSEAKSKVLKPVASGDKTYSGGKATIDASNISEGYIMVQYSGSSKNVKLQITKSGKNAYTYELGNSGKYEAFPLTGGDGNYSIAIFEHAGGNKYAQILTASIKVKLRNSMLPFLYPSQYVNFNKDSEVVKKSNALSKGAADQVAVVSEIYNFVIKNISYDNEFAKKVTSGSITSYVPKVDSVLSKKKGICLDYSAVMTAMLRAQGIPTRLEVGYVSGGVYHAWISVYIKDVGWVNNVIQFDGKSWKLMDPTFASGAGAQYVGDGKNYSTQYIY